MSVQIITGDCRDVLRTLADESVHCVVTSPPYFGLRDYGVAGQIGLEPTPDEFVAELVAVFRDVRRVLRDDGTLWLNLGDSYNAYNGGAGPSSALSRGAQTTARPQLATGYGLKFKGLKPKNLIGIPWRVAFALQADGWYLRQDIIWSKPNPLPESVTDRCTKAHEYIFLMSKSARYFYDADAISESAMSEDHWRNSDSPSFSAVPGAAPHRGLHRSSGNKNHKGTAAIDAGSEEHRTKAGLLKISDTVYPTRNKRSVWTIATSPFAEAHFATFPHALIKPCILAGCPAGGTVLDPFGGAGTTGLVADRLQRNAVLIELNPEYAAMARRRIDGDAPLFAKAAE